MNYDAWFQCSEGCDETYPLTEIIYRCRNCGGLLEVQHNMDELKQRSAADWKTLFEKRYRRTQYPYGSGVWGKKELVCPNIDDDNIISMYEGGTNLFWAERFGTQLGLHDLWIKQCGNSHTGSFKDLGMTVLVSMVNQIIAESGNIRAVMCASTGDTSAALAAYASAAGIPAIILLPKAKVTREQLIQPIANGALTLSLETDFDGCMEIVQKLAGRKDFYLANSINSLRIEGQKTISIEIVQQFNWEIPDWIIIPGGNLGNVSALGLGFLMMYELGIIDKLPRIACAQAERANPLYRSYQTGFTEFSAITAQATQATAIQIGNPVSVHRAIRILKRFDGIVDQATEVELADAAARADRTGLFNCPHTGVALAVLIKMVARKQILPDHRVIVISTATGLKFPDFKVAYHNVDPGEPAPRYLNAPIELEADYESVLKQIGAHLDP
ncbi:threonine synthase [Candidatus Poribacteria bacterium]|nr:threonine synthase [Candidatus Poribacteria bacterium]MYG07892.1 threonine synthase [Candidatus Poribacteria bacterium]MYK21050.1 threonine synthase [Candidatus Poribacteria bacterium]